MKRRNRSVEEHEVGPLLGAIDALGEPTRTLLNVLLYTGVRSGELLRAPWSEIDLKAGVWTLPPERQKLRLDREQDAKPWRIPLAPPVVAMLERLRSFDRKSPWVAASSDSEEGHITDKVLGRALRRLQTDSGNRAAVLKLDGARLRPHDFRRALRSWLMRNGCPIDVAERCLGHSLAALGGVVSTYAVDDLFDARRQWLERWAEHLESHRPTAGGPARVEG
jgi:integrase